MVLEYGFGNSQICLDIPKKTTKDSQPLCVSLLKIVTASTDILALKLTLTTSFYLMDEINAV